MATGIKTLIQEVAQPLLDAQIPVIVKGVVKSTSPLSIGVVNDMKINLSSVSLTIPSRLQPIKNGDQFYMISTNKNQMYYLLDRV